MRDHASTLCGRRVQQGVSVDVAQPSLVNDCEEWCQMTLGQDIFVSFLEHAWKFIKGEAEIRDVKRMSPDELGRWREEECRKIHDKSVEHARLSSDKELAKTGETRADVIRVY